MADHDRADRRTGTVVGLGAVAVDDLLYVDAELADGKGRIKERQRMHGGNTATALAAIARLGGRARYVGMLPDRARWADVHGDLAEWGVDTADATVVDGAHPVCSTIVVTPSGERFIAFDDSGAVGPPPDLRSELVTAADALLVDGYGPAATLRAVRAARAAGVPAIGDFERLPSVDSRALVREIEHLVIPLNFARELSHTRHPAAAVEELWNEDRAAVVVTDGDNGVWFKERGAPVVHAPAFEVAVVDTTGCGDIFHGAYSLSIARRHSVAEAVTFAAAAAALGATERGGRGHLPETAEVTTLIASGSRRRYPTPLTHSPTSSQYQRSTQ